jgi:plasmid stabilization system protein ParE
MPAVAFDTLKLAQRLEAAGFSSRQAQDTAAALAETLTGAIATAADVEAVRADIRESESRLRGEIREVETRLQAEIRETELRLRAEIAAVRIDLRTEVADVRTEILKWVIGAIGFQTVVILGAVAALIRLLH